MSNSAVVRLDFSPVLAIQGSSFPTKEALIVPHLRCSSRFWIVTQRSGFAYARLHAGLTSGRAYGARSLAMLVNFENVTH